MPAPKPISAPNYDPKKLSMSLDPIGYSLPLGNNPYDLQKFDERESHKAYEICRLLGDRGERLANETDVLTLNSAWGLEERLHWGRHGRLLGYLLTESVNPDRRSEVARVINTCTTDEELIQWAELCFYFLVLVCQFILFLRDYASFFGSHRQNVSSSHQSW